jgi:MATE family multidrug resistance protein
MAGFLVVRLAGIGAAVGTEALGNWFAGQNNTHVSLVASLVVMALNVPLAWALIHGRLGLPALGVQGAALASTLATWAGFLVAALAFARAPRALPTGRLRLRELLRFVRYGLPNGLNWFVEFAAFLVFVDVVFARLGTPALAALMAVLQLNSLAFMPAFGVASAGAIQVGNALGAGAPDAVPALVRRTTLVAVAWMVLVGVGYGAAPAALLAVFAKGDGALELATVGVRLLWVSIAWQLSDALSVVLSEALRAAGDTTWPMAARIALSWVFFVPAAWWTARAGGGPVAVLLWVVVYITLLAALLYARFRRGAWRTMDLRSG